MAYEHLTTFNPNSAEYDSLQRLRDKLNSISERIKYKIETIYFDAGQNWLYTTLIAYDTQCLANDILSSWQALTPNDQKTALFGTSDEVDALIDKLITNNKKRY